MRQNIEALTPHDAARLEMQRAGVRDHYDVAARDEYATVAGERCSMPPAKKSPD
jgi:hypothetical protein